MRRSICSIVLILVIISSTWANSFFDLIQRPVDWMELYPELKESTLALTTQSLKSAILEGIEVDTRSHNNLTPLMLVSWFNTNPELLTTLIELGADIEARDDWGKTALIWASANSSSPEIIKTLLDAGSDVNSRETNGRTPLMAAIVQNKSGSAIINQLFNAGANIVAVDDQGQTPLMLALLNYNIDPAVLNTLLDASVDINARDKKNRTSLILLSENQQFPDESAAVISDRIVAILEKGADSTLQDDSGKNAWDYISENPKLLDTVAYFRLEAENRNHPTKTEDQSTSVSSIEQSVSTENSTLELEPIVNPPEGVISNRLLHSQKNINQDESVSSKSDSYYRFQMLTRSPNRLTVAEIAKSMTVDTVQIAVENGAIISQRTKEGWTPLMLLAAYTSNPLVIKAMLKAGADIEARDLAGRTALIRAVWSNISLDVVEVLLESGADIEAENINGWTPLMYATQGTNQEILELLIDKGADLTHSLTDGTNRTAWDLIQENKDLQDTRAYAQLLVKSGGDINFRDDNNLTLLLKASKEGKGLDQIKFLIESGADIEATNKNLRSVLSFAMTSESPLEVVKLLVDSGADIESRDLNGNTPLMWAALLSGNSEKVKLLLESRANIEASNVDGWTSLMFAAIGKNEETLQVLLDYGALSQRVLLDSSERNAWDLIQGNQHLKGSQAYWRLNDLRFQ